MAEQPAPDLQPRPPLPSITLDYARPWTVVLPSIFRYEHTEFIDEFFETGRIRLSSFEQFAKYPDEHRGDPNEGKAVLRGIGANHEVWMVGRWGIAALVLCCSTRLDRELMKSFDRTGVFEIIDPPAFGAEVARQIAGFRRGMSGHCLYREDDSFLARAIDFDPERHRRPDGGVELSAPALAQQIGGDETVLLKSTRYRTQAEYRLMWELDRLDSDHLFVDAPSARQFCRRVEQLL